MTSHGAHRTFTRRCWVSRAMRLLAHAQLGNAHGASWYMPKHCPVVLLALAAHHDEDAVNNTMPGYTAAELSPFVGLAVGTVATALRELHRAGFLLRYKGDRNVLRYIIDVHTFATHGSEWQGSEVAR